MQALLRTPAEPLARDSALVFSTNSLLLDRDFSANTSMQDCNIEKLPIICMLPESEDRRLRARFKPRQTSVCKYENAALFKIEPVRARRMHRLL